MGKKGYSSATCNMDSDKFTNFKVKVLWEKSDNIAVINRLLKEWLKKPYTLRETVKSERSVVVGFFIEKELKTKIMKELAGVNQTLSNLLATLVEDYVNG